MLSLGGNKLGGAISADVAVFTNLKELGLNNMGLDGKPLSPRTERLLILLIFIDLKLCRAVCQAASRKSSRA